MKKRKTSGQIDLSFGMIFSIILIVIFLIFAFFVIKKFLGMKSDVETGKLIEDLRNDVDKMWKSSQGSQEIEYSVPSKAEQICFVDYNSESRGRNLERYSKLKQVYNGEENLFFYPVGSGNGLDAVEIQHISIEKITEKENPYCILSEDGKIVVTISKGFNEALVTIR